MRKIRVSVSFVKGFERALDLNGTKEWPKISSGGAQADYSALRSDWEDVGKTIRREFQGPKRVGR